MARVIKGDSQGFERRRGVPRLKRAPGKKVIEKEVYSAQEKAREILKEAELEKANILKQGAQDAAQIREEMQAQGAEEAFSEAAQEALSAFHRRWGRYEEASEDIRILALEVSRKILGMQPRIDEAVFEEIIQKGMAELRARRTLRIQLPESRHRVLSRERPKLWAQLEEKADLVLESVPDVREGFARIMTEIGGALCSEQTALDQLADSIGVSEEAVAPSPLSRMQTENLSGPKVNPYATSETEKETQEFPLMEGAASNIRTDVNPEKLADTGSFDSIEGATADHSEEGEAGHGASHRSGTRPRVPSDISHFEATDQIEPLVNEEDSELDLFADENVHKR